MIVGSRGVSIPFQISILDGSYVVFQRACFSFDGDPYSHLLRGLYERELGRFCSFSFLITWILRCKSVVNLPDSQAYLRIEKAHKSDSVIFDLRQRFLPFWMVLSFAADCP